VKRATGVYWTPACLYLSARTLKDAGLRKQHPDWSESRIKEQTRDIFLYAGNTAALIAAKTALAVRNTQKPPVVDRGLCIRMLLDLKMVAVQGLEPRTLRI
jgi:hypothetical protein